MFSTSSAEAARAGELGRDGRELKAIRVTRRESPRRARLVRGAVVVKRVRVRRAGRSCDPDRRLRL